MNVWHGTDRRPRMYVAHFGRFWRSKGSRMDHSSTVAWNDRVGWARVASGSRAASARVALKLPGFGSNGNADSVER